MLAGANAQFSSLLDQVRDEVFRRYETEPRPKLTFIFPPGMNGATYHEVEDRRVRHFWGLIEDGGGIYAWVHVNYHACRVKYREPFVWEVVYIGEPYASDAAAYNSYHTSLNFEAAQFRDTARPAPQLIKTAVPDTEKKRTIWPLLMVLLLLLTVVVMVIFPESWYLVVAGVVILGVLCYWWLINYF